MITTTYKNKSKTLIPFRRSRGAGKDSPFVSLAKTGFNFSTGFCKEFNIRTDCNQYIIFQSDGEGQFGFWISSSEEDMIEYLNCPALKLQSSGNRKGFGISAKEFRAAFTTHIEDQMVKDKRSSMHFYPQLLPCSSGHRKMPDSIKFFVFEAGKLFEKSISPQQLQDDTSYSRTPALYRYLDENGDVNYIGQGYLRDRFMSDARTTDWGVYSIEYSVVPDEVERKNLENKATRAYEDKYGCLPKYNKKHGG